MIRYVLLSSVLWTATGLSAQTVISGTVKSSKDNSPVESASVYINGTSLGTTSDKDGHFTISKVNFPSLIVISHVSYEMATLQLDNIPAKPLEIMLNEKMQEINSISVTGKDMWNENYKMFKKHFLYRDEFASTVKFLNPKEALYFSRRVDSTVRPVDKCDYILKAFGKKFNWTGDSLFIIEYEKIFSTKTTVPLVLLLSNMGYKVRMDIEFYNVMNYNTEKQSSHHWSSYSYSIPVEPLSESEEKKFETNRHKAYYNSMRHFEKSLFDNSLKENGFIIPEYIPPQESIYKTAYRKNTGEPYDVFIKLKKPEYSTIFDITPFLEQKYDEVHYIIGLKGLTFRILFFCKGNNEPINLNNYKNIPWIYSKEENISYITFLQDTCIISKNGKSSGLKFSGRMTRRRIGTYLLPDDYEPAPLNAKKR
jgi:hypothetical protein